MVVLEVDHAALRHSTLDRLVIVRLPREDAVVLHVLALLGASIRVVVATVQERGGCGCLHGLSGLFPCSLYTQQNKKNTVALLRSANHLPSPTHAIAIEARGAVFLARRRRPIEPVGIALLVAHDARRRHGVELARRRLAAVDVRGVGEDTLAKIALDLRRNRRMAHVARRRTITGIRHQVGIHERVVHRGTRTHLAVHDGEVVLVEEALSRHLLTPIELVHGDR